MEIPFGSIQNLTSGLALQFWDLDNSHYAGIKANNTTTASLTYTLPAAGPAVSGYVLSSTTAGVMSWVVQEAPTGANLTAGSGLTFASGTGVGAVLVAVEIALSAGSIASLGLADTSVQPARQIISGDGLTGGGDLSANRTLAVGAGTGITVNANDVAISNTAVSPDTYGSQTQLVQLAVDQQGRITSIVDITLPVLTLSSQYTDVGNVGTGADDLMTYTLLGGTLAGNGDRLIIRMFAVTSAALNDKTINVYVFGTNVRGETDSSGVAQNHAFTVEVIRVDATTVRVLVSDTSFPSGMSAAVPSTVTATLANNQVIKMVGTGTSNNDIVQKSMTIEFHKAT